MWTGQFVQSVVLVGCILCQARGSEGPNMKGETETMVPHAMRGGDRPDDAMPHSFADHIRSAKTEMSTFMNAYMGGIADEHVPPNKVLPVASLSKEKQIPFLENEPSTTHKSLDDISTLLNAMKRAHIEADNHDSIVSRSGQEDTAGFVGAKSSHEAAQNEVAMLKKAKEAKEANDLSRQMMQTKDSLLLEKLAEKAELIKEESMLKLPLVKQVGRANILLKKAIAAKKSVLDDFGTQPSLSEAEKSQIVNTYNELLVNLKQQVALLHKTAEVLLTPVQLNINQTINDVERLNTEIAEIRAEMDSKLALANKYTPQAMDIANAIAADAEAHYSALQAGVHEHNRAFERRSNARADALRLLESIRMQLANVNKPQEPFTGL